MCIRDSAYRDKVPLAEVEKRLSNAYGDQVQAKAYRESVAEAYKELESMVADGLLSCPDDEDEDYTPSEETIAVSYTHLPLVSNSLSL